MDLNVRHLGRQPYEPVWRAMQAFTEQRDDSTVDELWFVEHDPVFTQGQAGKAEHVLAPGDIPVIKIDRGGQVTYHGPGQLVVYLMLDVRRSDSGPRKIVSAIEQAIIKVLAGYGIESHAKPEAPGVYIDDAKIAALGLRFRKMKSYHGLSFNLDMDTEPFNRINPCGYEGLQVAQLRDLIDTVSWDEVSSRLLECLMTELGYNDAHTKNDGIPFLENSV
ncbi:octanoyltransferase [Endozoicomonas sp. OPT23]|uniref:lipoyl(octanoyl) transferase LipB n=1 Tax=Endozoicomonas sp. OPT23 TaxID=2072845 RepID=UPI00129BE5AD|nr:lipoyl(octanoyl) transferase LipB [Endozoicomonas sp. OPT23]MRI33575.1 octanoyltransferase [Endozoicomonas sp. OPT23]